MNDKKTLLIVGPKGTGGIDRYITEQRRYLEDRMHVRLYTRYTAPKGDGLERATRMILSSLYAILLFPFQSRPDIVHVHSSHTYSFFRSAFFVLFSAYVWRVPVVLHIHGSSFDEFLATDSRLVRRLQSAVFDTVDDVVVLSEYWRGLVAQLADEEKVHVIANAVDPTEYDPTYLTGPVHLVFISNLIERKGIDELLDAIEVLASMPDLSFEVSIGGGGPFANRVEAIASEHDNVTYYGFVPEAKKQELISRGTVFVLPTHAEGLPIAMLEGMAGGNAVVSTPVGSIPEVITDDRGILVTPGEARELAEALAHLIANPEEAVRMGRTNRALIEERYSWQSNADNLVEMYADAN
ncbi:glycosyltransferase family 1 protein (plasmid) [Haloferax mediterranei ATCC 33500]|uniref:Glycosyltransferase family 1 protein n=1 Tax=Haloferax mediterranei (strain ATCC 33500 / DSM 1411 / JCM 8866 / NBRC 14739 / NCIMB 2177 / R-4) TaxID=523841 RepID=I3RAT7_HALMT|nr:glycosyltransferase family 4 protein [Haloferax mediterranei]AFK21347.1 LPS glycosyltransferase [Haloferax mediterranei ATCC 33500]ELZ97326.1 LPS glycosyltransferase [Haloferax mediterranei ATCC 33500]MDX5990377.1 glycosyltransferase family 4 protein [Haloferax mediterranei ATCC 33500]QCQ76963.1 glycosyltransferase family 1 protein [Haloferax mediterranei ATCC 33500]